MFAVRDYVVWWDLFVFVGYLIVSHSKPLILLVAIKQAQQEQMDNCPKVG